MVFIKLLKIFEEKFINLSWLLSSKKRGKENTEMKRKILAFALLIFAIAAIVAITAVTATVIKGENAFYLTKYQYAPSEIFEGNINISLEKEPTDSSVKVKISPSSYPYASQKRDLLSFLQNTSASFECVPSDCRDYYKEIGRTTQPQIEFVQTSVTSIALPIEKGACDSFSSITINSITFDITGQELDNKYPVPQVDVGADDVIEWRYLEPSAIFSPLNSISGEEVGYKFLDPEWLYCQKITFRPASRYKFEADVPSPITFSLYEEKEGYMEKVREDSREITCKASPVVGYASCTVNFTNYKQKDFFVCLSGQNKSDKIKTYKGEDGYYMAAGGYIATAVSPQADFPIFAFSALYRTLNFTLAVSGTEIVDSVQEYMEVCDERGANKTCLVPLQFFSPGGKLLLNNLRIDQT